MNKREGKKRIQVLYCDFCFYKLICLHRVIILKYVLQTTVLKQVLLPTSLTKISLIAYGL